ncbi:T9SS type A sorting domain-containing protein [Psychroserpens sp. BH13MA-6]
MKKSFALIVTILITANSLAQLTVRNNAYVFVNDEIIFVNDNVNLQEANSKVYLRNEAQLIQGSGTTGNSGLGELSVYQTGTTNNFAYNYWCSPVGNNSASLGNESARVNLIDEATNIVTAADPTGLISSSDALFTTAYDGTASPLTISNRWLYSYVSSDQYADWIELDENSAILPGLGYTMKGIGAGGQLYDFRGKPNNGTITNSIAADQFTLIGNPYPSAIDALLLIHDPQNTNIDVASGPEYTPTTTGVLYYWEQQPTDHYTANYIGGYAAYTISAGGVETTAPATFYSYDDFGNAYSLPPGPGGTGVKIAQRYIPIGQGFMVEGSPTTPPGSLVYVKNSHRVFEKESGGNSYFFRTSEANTNNVDDNGTQYNEHGLNIVPNDFKRFRLNIIFNDTFTRQLVQNFHDTATDGFDYGLEAKTASEAPNEISWVLDGVPYVIQAHSFDVEKTIPLIVNLDAQQNLDFSIFDVQNFDESQPIYIHDIQADLYVDLRQQNYSVNLPAGEHNNRFEVTFQAETLSNEVITAKDFDVFQHTQNSELVVLNPNGFNIKTLSLVDVSGKLVANAQNIGTSSEYRHSTKSLSEGVYIATITTDTNQSLSKKIVIKN